MPIASYRHNLAKSEDGRDWFIVRTPRQVSRTIMNVRFTDGEGRTKFEEKAKAFDEEFGYEIILPAGHPGWILKPSLDSTEAEKYEWETNYTLTNEEGEEIEVSEPGMKGRRR